MHRSASAVVYLTDKHFVRRPVITIHYTTQKQNSPRACYRRRTEFGQRICQYLPGTERDKHKSSMEHNKHKRLQTRRVLSLKERIDVIRIAELQRDTRQLAKQFDCGRTQILSILQQKDRLLKEWANNGDPNRLRRRPSAFSVAINKIVAEWITRCRSAQLSLTDKMIMDKAYQAKKFFKYGEFRPNKRWLDRFKRRFRLDGVDLVTPNPAFGDGIIKSMKISEIFEDIKDTLESNIIDTMTDRQSTLDYQQFLQYECSSEPSPAPADSIVDQTVSSNNDVSECDDNEDMPWQFENFCETQIIEESMVVSDGEPEPAQPTSDAISSDLQALECLKKLEEYSMLKENFRAIGLIVQLEQLYKGQLEA